MTLKLPRSDQWAFLSLLALLFFLPLYEAPKNLFFILFIIFSLFYFWQSKAWGKWDYWDVIGLAMVGSVSLSIAFAGASGAYWGAVSDTVRIFLVLILLKRFPIDDKRLTHLFIALTIGAVLALIWAIWKMYVQHSKISIELNSIGHVNHSAIYLAITLLIVFSLFVITLRKFGMLQSVTLFILMIMIGSGLILTNSRGALGAAIVALITISFLWRGQFKWFFPATMVILVILASAAIVGKVGVVQKQVQQVQNNDQLSGRVPIWNRAWLTWAMSPWFGVGKDNFSAIPDDQLEKFSNYQKNPDILTSEKSSFGELNLLILKANPFKDAAIHPKAQSSHAHNLYLNTIAETGLLGFLAFCFFFFAWIVCLLRFYPKHSSAMVVWVLWGSSFCAWIIMSVNGIVNTTFHHENALLAVILLGTWLAIDKREQKK